MKNQLKITGYSDSGQALLYVPAIADLLEIDMQKKKAGFITANLPTTIEALKERCIPLFSEMTLNLSAVISELDLLHAYSGIYIVNNLTKRLAYLGQRKDWNEIAEKLNGVVLARDGKKVFA